MAPATASPKSEGSDRRREASDLALRWSGQISLTRRILAVNIFALLLLAGGFFYLDSYRSRLLDARVAQYVREGRLIAESLAMVGPEQRDDLITRLARDTGARLRIFDGGGRTIADSRDLGVRNAVLLDPDKQAWNQSVARFLDAAIDTIVGAVRPPLYRERGDGREWPDVSVAAAQSKVSGSIWRAPDRTPVITVAAPLPGKRVVMSTINARDITQTVRIERFRLSIVLLVVTLVSVLLSLFLARTIVKPLRRLALLWRKAILPSRMRVSSIGNYTKHMWQKRHRIGHWNNSWSNSIILLLNRRGRNSNGSKR